MNNSSRHVCLYHAIPCMGSVLHTINIKIQPTHIAYTIQNAHDSCVFIDEDLLDEILLYLTISLSVFPTNYTYLLFQEVSVEIDPFTTLFNPYLYV